MFSLTENQEVIMNIGDDYDDQVMLPTSISAPNTAVFASDVITDSNAVTTANQKPDKPNDYIQLAFLAFCLNLLCGIIALSYSSKVQPRLYGPQSTRPRDYPDKKAIFPFFIAINIKSNALYMYL